jgi:hypothetical protein
MGTKNMWPEFRLGSVALERRELIVGKGANRIRAVPFHSIRSSVTRTLLPSGRWREGRPALSRFSPSPPIYSFRSIPGELRRPSCRVFDFQLEIRL